MPRPIIVDEVVVEEGVSGSVRRSRVDRITGSTGKSIEGERVTDGLVVAVRRGNARGAKEPCCL